jgi:uncharacterized protein YbjQ (UPF0145 family)
MRPELAGARDRAEEMEERARALGANAVVGVDLDYEVINNMLMVSPRAPPSLD